MPIITLPAFAFSMGGDHTRLWPTPTSSHFFYSFYGLSGTEIRDFSAAFEEYFEQAPSDCPVVAVVRTILTAFVVDLLCILARYLVDLANFVPDGRLFELCSGIWWLDGGILVKVREK